MTVILRCSTPPKSRLVLRTTTIAFCYEWGHRAADYNLKMRCKSCSGRHLLALHDINEQAADSNEQAVVKTEPTNVLFDHTCRAITPGATWRPCSFEDSPLMDWSIVCQSSSLCLHLFCHHPWTSTCGKWVFCPGEFRRPALTYVRKKRCSTSWIAVSRQWEGR